MREAVAAAARQLRPVSDTPRLDAELLMAHALGLEREAMLLGGLDGETPANFGGLVERRLRREPVAYITGIREFWSLPISVGPGVLIPRPDSETLIEAALEALAERPPARILDLGTGSGALLLAALAEWPNAEGVGVDRSKAAIARASANAERLGFGRRARVVEGDWADGLSGQFDLVLCNPPYVAEDAPLAPEIRNFEPAGALFAGPGGLDAYRALVPGIARILAPGGVACLEIGADQARPVASLVAQTGLETKVRTDLAGRDRCLVIHG